MKYVKSRPLLDADYSAIEARITCWLAGQEDALEEYRQGVDRYKRMASVIYGIPEEQVNKHPQRFIGKQAVLGCGFGMGPAKFRGTCENFGYKDLPAGLEEKAVASFRAKHPKIKSYWKLIENAAKRAIVEKGTVVTVRNVKLLCRDREGMPFLHMQLPSGRQLSYPHPRIRPSRKFEGATEIVFFGHIKGVMWGDVPTWGGTLVENCLAGQTEVLSQHRGWVRLDSVTTQDHIWDGVEFVQHQGLLRQGEQNTMTFHGLRCTPDHKFLTEEGWISAQTACTNPHIKLSSLNEIPILPTTWPTFRFDWSGIWDHDSDQKRAGDWKKNHMDLPVQMWNSERENWLRVTAAKNSGVWEAMSFFQSSDRGSKYNAWDEQASSLCGVEFHERPMPFANSPSMAQLRSPRHQSLQTVAQRFREFLGGHGTDLLEGSGHRPAGQQWGLHSEELPVGYSPTQLAEPEEQHQNPWCAARFLDHRGSIRDQTQHASLSLQSGPELGTNHQHAARFSEQVYDIKNCGPRHRFAVRGNTGKILIAHNCVQAVAADIMANGTRNAERAGYETATLIHDQCLSYYHPERGQTVEEFVRLLTTLPKWGENLPLEAEGSLVPFYRKD